MSDPLLKHSLVALGTLFLVLGMVGLEGVAQAVVAGAGGVVLAAGPFRYSTPREPEGHCLLRSGVALGFALHRLRVSTNPSASASTVTDRLVWLDQGVHQLLAGGRVDHGDLDGLPVQSGRLGVYPGSLTASQ
ncbi:hypothetical protein ACIHCQ_42715 [Streptomyces sp. NPDC052236]|uniref:hypothetical protein n=1 Tax=Streptomyces sp. NPDC052236 TaxID=3365686 RepID=UPI0037D4E7B3